MTYYSGNNVSAGSFMDFRGPIGPNLPYPDDATAATGPIAALIGYGYGHRGYGQLNTFLPPKDPGNRVSSIEWNAMQAAMSNINIHTGSGLEMQPRVDILGQIIAEDGVDSTANIELLATTLDTNRMLFADDQMGSKLAISSTRNTSWNNTIMHEFTVDFDTEDKARWYFNSGGAINLSAERYGGTTSNVTVVTNPFVSPALYPVSYSTWSTFLNSTAVWVSSNPNEKADQAGNILVFYRNFSAPYNGTYRFTFQADNQVTLYVDGVLVGVSTNYAGDPSTVDMVLSAGPHVLRFEGLNYPPSAGDNDWDNNPSGWGIAISAVFWETRDHLAAEVIPGSPSFTSPRVYAIAPFGTWSSFMNSNSVWVNAGTDVLRDQTQNIYRNFVAPYTGSYTIEIAADDRLKLYVDNVLVANIYRNYGSSTPAVVTTTMTAGAHVLRFEALNDGNSDAWNNNPAGWSVVISSGSLWTTRTHAAAESVTSTSFTSPRVYAVTSSAGDWSAFMNAHAVWTSASATSNVNVTQTRHRLLTINTAGNYTFTYAVDDSMKIFLNENQIISANVSTSRINTAPGTKILNLSPGTYVLRVDAYNNPVRGGWAITVTNPDGYKIWDTRDHLAPETVPGPQGGNTTVITDGTTNALVSNLFINSGTVTISADTVTSSGTIGNVYVGGYYNLGSEFTTLFAAYDQGATYTNARTKSAVYTTSASDYAYKVPDSVTLLEFKLWGAGGAGGVRITAGDVYQGGAGAYLSATVPVTPGETLTVRVGGGGQVGGFSSGSEDSYGGGGGGYTGVFRGTTPVLIAAGGGGSPTNSTDNTTGTAIWNTRTALAAETIAGPPPFTSPQVYAVTWTSWSTFMNTYAVWTEAGSSHTAPVTKTIYRNFTATYSGNYNFKFAADNTLNLYIDGVFVGTTSSFTGDPVSANLSLSAGAHVLKFEATNRDNPSPAGYAVVISALRAGGKGGAGGVAQGSDGTLGDGTASGLGGTQSAGGNGGAGDGTAWNGAKGALFQGGYGGNHDVANGKWIISESYNKNVPVNPGINGGLHGGAMGGETGAGGGGGGYFGGGGGGGAVKGSPGLYNSGGGGGGSSYIGVSAGNVVAAVSPDWYTAPNKTDNDYLLGVAAGGAQGVNITDTGAQGGPGLAVIYTVGSVVPPSSKNWIVTARREKYSGTYGGNGSLIRVRSIITSDQVVNGGVPVPHPVCISVINEVSPSAATIQASYDKFRSQFPNHYLYLLWPQGSHTISELKIPNGWSTARGDFGPIVIHEDYGNVNLREDWYALCNLNQLSSGSRIGIFIDNSGSLGIDKVRASYEYLLQRIAARNISQLTVTNNEENWISPFLPMTLSAPVSQSTNPNDPGPNGTIASNISRRKAQGVLQIEEPVFKTIRGLDYNEPPPPPPQDPVANLTCIAVIDEVSPSAATIQASYVTFRQKWPNRNLYLFQPGGPSRGDLKIPQGWNPSLGDFGPTPVNRDNGDVAKKSDWYALALLDRLPSGSKVGLFIDKSGSMNLDTVRASYEYLLQRLAERGMSVVMLTNTAENWVEPFIPIIL